MTPTKGSARETQGSREPRGLGRAAEAQRRGPREPQVQAPGARFSSLHPEVPSPGASGGTDRGCPQWAPAGSSPPSSAIRDGRAVRVVTWRRRA